MTNCQLTIVFFRRFTVPSQGSSVTLAFSCMTALKLSSLRHTNDRPSISWGTHAQTPAVLLDYSDVTGFAKSCILFLGTSFLLGLDYSLSEWSFFALQIQNPWEARDVVSTTDDSSARYRLSGKTHLCMSVCIFKFPPSSPPFCLHRYFPSLFSSFRPIDNRTWRFFPPFQLTL